jgi:hypothetical protein
MGIKKLMGIAITTALGITIVVNTGNGTGMIYKNNSAHDMTVLVNWQTNTGVLFTSDGEVVHTTAHKAFNPFRKTIESDDFTDALVSTCGNEEGK